MIELLRGISGRLRKAVGNDFYFEEIFFIPLFIALILVRYFLGDGNFPLNNFDERSISQATYNGIDISLRVSAFYKCMGIIFVAFILLVPVLIKAKERFFHDDEIKILNATSLAGVVLFFFSLIGADLSHSFHLIFSLQGILILSVAFRKMFSFTDTDENFISLFAWVVCISFSLFFFHQIVFHLLNIHLFVSLPKFILIVSTLIFAGYYFLGKKIETKDKILQWLYSGKTLMWLPLLSFACAEGYMIFNQRGHFHFNPYIIYFSGLTAIGCKVFLNFRKTNKNIPLQNKLANYILPLLVISISWLANYKAIVNIDVDTFEDANKMLPVQQYFEFGKIPFVHDFSSHALNDFFFGFLYSFFNGYNAFGGVVYGFLILPLFTICLYFLVKEISNVWLAVFISLFYPFSGFMFPPYYNLILLSVLVLLNVLKNQSFKNYFLFFLLLFFMPVWRIDLGLANFFAALGGFLLMVFFKKDFIVEIKNLLKGLVFSSSLFVLTFIILLVKFGSMIFMSMRDALAYLSSFQSYGIKDLSSLKDIYYYSHYFVFPVLIFVMLISVIRKLAHQKNESAEEIAFYPVLIFFSLFYFANFQRGLVRHTLVEDWDTALSSFCFFILPAGILFLAKRKNEIAKAFIFLSATTLFVFAYRYTTPDFTSNNQYHAFVKATEQSIIPERTNYKIDRTPTATAFYKNFCGELDTLIRKNFSSSSTFIDFSNAPMLYYYLHRITPNYLNQIPHTAHTVYLQERFLEDLKKYELPLVTYSSYPKTWWGNLDGIPNTLRHYLIAEYIFKNYKPAYIISDRCIWLKKDLNVVNNRREIFSSGNFSSAQVSDAKMADSTHVNSGNANPYINKIIKDEAGIKLSGDKKHYLLFNFTSSSAGSMSVQFSYNKKEFNAQAQTSKSVSSGNNLLFAVINNSDSVLSDLKIFLPKNCSVSMGELKIIEADIIDDYFSGEPVDASLGWIPYIWAQYDKTCSEGNLKEIAKISSDPFTVVKENEKRISFQSVSDKTDGNYIFMKAKNNSQSTATLILNYGEGENKNGGFSFIIPAGAEENNYLLRISSQYNWYAKNNNWISLYPMDADIFISGIKITKGN